MSKVIQFPNMGLKIQPPESVVTIETGGAKPLILPHIITARDWYGLREDLRDPNTVVKMRLGYAVWRHLEAVVVDARCMLQFNRYVIVQLQIAHFDDGT